MIRETGYSREHIEFSGKKVDRCGVGAAGAPGPSIAGHEPCPELIASILGSAGLSADAYRATSMNRRLAACLRTLKSPTVPEACRRLTERPRLNIQALDSLMIGVTEFFRDAPVFCELGSLIREHSENSRNGLRIWSAGCSNGAELYSLAILLAEAGLLNRCTMIGTDCRRSAIREARAGLYSESNLRSMDGSLREKYMRKVGPHWRVIEPLRLCIQWRIRDLLSGCEKGPWDMVLWRNMAIYFEVNTAIKTWNAVSRELRPGGLVIAGKAERPPKSAGLMNISRCIYRLPLQAGNANCY